ncbi:MAG TPA: Rrf2 family transcriptional regulator [Rickettsiales bacterium]|nr:Rrf2 family transcriptional regulator [Rickettsiales bacterium]
MILTTKGRYAVIAMLDLLEEGAYGEKPCPISLLAIAKRQHISLSYLEQIFANLRRCAIVKSVKGPGGGYVLGRKPEEISVSDIVLATGERIKITACGNSKKGCNMPKNGNKHCKTHDLWFGLEKNIHDYLQSISINDIYQNGTN